MKIILSDPFFRINLKKGKHVILSYDDEINKRSIFILTIYSNICIMYIVPFGSLHIFDREDMINLFADNKLELGKKYSSISQKNINYFNLNTYKKKNNINEGNTFNCFIENYLNNKLKPISNFTTFF